MSEILVVAAHADDEVLGCGGTIAKHAANGDNVTVLFLADGVNSREQGGDDLDAREQAARKAMQILGAGDPIFWNFPDNRMDTVALLDVAKMIEATIAERQPSRIYTHFVHDLNVDHRIVCEAVHTATRPQLGQPVAEILCFEVLSSTEWNFQSNQHFKPNYFVDIEDHFQTKMNAVDAYEMEMRAFPHPRSHTAIEALATIRGSSAGMMKAEGFILSRALRHKGAT